MMPTRRRREVKASQTNLSAPRWTKALSRYPPTRSGAHTRKSQSSSARGAHQAVTTAKTLCDGQRCSRPCGGYEKATRRGFTPASSDRSSTQRLYSTRCKPHTSSSRSTIFTNTRTQHAKQHSTAWPVVPVPSILVKSSRTSLSHTIALHRSFAPGQRYTQVRIALRITRMARGQHLPTGHSPWLCLPLPVQQPLVPCLQQTAVRPVAS
jgi:hypothetical protein